MTYKFGNADIRKKNGVIFFNVFLNLQITVKLGYNELDYNELPVITNIKS